MIKLIEAMNDQPIAFNKHYVFIGCGINGALMLSQLVYWTARSKNDEGWIYKTHHEWTMETGLTRKEQETARKTLKHLGFITEIKKGVPCKVYFKVERENLYKALIEYSESLDSSQLRKSGQLDAQIVQTECAKTDNCVRKSGQLDAQISPSITENTTENTTDIILGVSASEQQKAKSQKFSAKKFLIENGVSENTAQEYIDLRNKKRKSITERTLQLVFNQAIEARLSNERVFQIIVVRGWDSFKAAWNWSETNEELDQLENPKIHQPQQVVNQNLNLPEKPKGFLGGNHA
jgi:hypothetical protein